MRLFGASEVSCQVRFTKNRYLPGEDIDIHLDCDNTNCSKAVKSYKFKLFR